MEFLELVSIAGQIASLGLLAYGGLVCLRWLSSEYSLADHLSGANLALLAGRSHGRDWGVGAH